MTDEAQMLSQEPRLKPGWAGMTRFKQLDDGRWVCFLAFDGRKARVLPSEAIGLDIRRDSTRVYGASIAVMFAVAVAAHLLDHLQTVAVRPRGARGLERGPGGMESSQQGRRAP